MNVRQNIGFPLKCQNYKRAEIRRSVEETAKLLRIKPSLDRRVGGSPAATGSALRSVVHRAPAQGFPDG